jgi:hypothetical protein
MRRKISKAEESDSDLPQLTEQQMMFVKGILDGKTGSDAYRAAYNCENMKPETIWAAASRLRHDDKVSAWLEVAREAEMASAKRTLDQHIQRLDRLQAIALRTGNVGAAVQAEQLIGKASGHYAENINISMAEPTDVLDEIRKLSPELAEQLSRNHLGTVQ